MLLAFGILCAAWERMLSGRGQVVDAAMIDGAAMMMAPFITGRASGAWGPRGTNMLDTGAPFYEVYETADGKWLAVGAIEPQFYAALLDGLGLSGDPVVADPGDREHWAAQKERFAAVVATRTRAEWCAVFDGTDACVAPVLESSEAFSHPHHVARRGFVDVGGRTQHAPAPRFSRTEPVTPQPSTGADALLARWGVTP
jgi:alpha-methylacyl-CoA racemase